MAHQPFWDCYAADCLRRLRVLLGPDAQALQHVGSTAVPALCAKPIVDLAVLLRQGADLTPRLPALEKQGFAFRGVDVPGQLLLVTGRGEMRAAHVHVLPAGSPAWQDYLDFCDYLRACDAACARSAQRKRTLAARHGADRAAYTAGKAQLVEELLRQARAWRAATP